MSTGKSANPRTHVRTMFFFFLDILHINAHYLFYACAYLDHFRLLTMPSGERIQFGPNVNFLFESHDLSCASPATISRMGMIFLRYVHMHVLKYEIVYLRFSLGIVEDMIRFMYFT